MAEIELQEGSLKEVWNVSFSLMVMFFSMMTMTFIDRLYLANYSQAALTAAASVGTLCWALTLGWSTLSMMSEVFVAQFNGAKLYQRLGEPVWQTLWIAFLSFFFFIPISLIGGVSLRNAGMLNHFEASFFQWSMLFAPIQVILTAFSGFYIGQGKTRIVKWLAVLGNTVNIILDPIFIFGVPGYFPSLGIAGAAIATAIGFFIQVVILAFLFFHRKNAQQFGTRNYRLIPELLFKCLKVGTPPALFVLFELLGWAIFYWMMSKIGTVHIVVASVCQSILLLFLFFGLGLEKGVAAVAGNLIGARKLEKVSRVARSGVLLVSIFASITLLLFTLFPDALITWFFNNPEALETDQSILEISASLLPELKSYIQSGLVFIAIYLAFENTRWVFSGILTAAGDTLFLMICGVISVWVFLLLPTYLFVFRPLADVYIAFYIWIFYSASATSIVFYRYRSGSWKNKYLVEEEERLPVSEPEQTL